MGWQGPEAAIAWYDEHLAPYWGPLPDEPARSLVLGLNLNAPSTVDFNGRRVEPLGFDLSREARDLLDAELARWRAAFRVGGRGHGKRYMLEKLRERARTHVIHSTPASEVDATRVKWSQKALIALRGGNVDVYTEAIPPHIAALPDEEQGPALVQAIFDRKKGLIT